jgi:very-short-patch-repair endonuclease
MTDAERALWEILRSRQVLDLKFRRPHPFGDYILDFVCLEKKLVIEVDGGQHAGRAKEDALRTENLSRAGFRVLRFWNHEVLQEIEGVTGRICGALEEEQPHPHPSPPLEGEGI